MQPRPSRRRRAASLGSRAPARLGRHRCRATSRRASRRGRRDGRGGLLSRGLEGGGCRRRRCRRQSSGSPLPPPMIRLAVCSLNTGERAVGDDLAASRWPTRRRARSCVGAPLELIGAVDLGKVDGALERPDGGGGECGHALQGLRRADLGNDWAVGLVAEPVLVEGPDVLCVGRYRSPASFKPELVGVWSSRKRRRPGRRLGAARAQSRWGQSTCSCTP
jgi:hypothetical protein